MPPLGSRLPTRRRRLNAPENTASADEVALSALTLRLASVDPFTVVVVGGLAALGARVLAARALLPGLRARAGRAAVRPRAAERREALEAEDLDQMLARAQRAPAGAGGVRDQRRASSRPGSCASCRSSSAPARGLTTAGALPDHRLWLPRALARARADRTPATRSGARRATPARVRGDRGRRRGGGGRRSGRGRHARALARARGRRVRAARLGRRVARRNSRRSTARGSTCCSRGWSTPPCAGSCTRRPARSIRTSSTAGAALVRERCEDCSDPVRAAARGSRRRIGAWTVAAAAAVQQCARWRPGRPTVN